MLGHRYTTDTAKFRLAKSKRTISSGISGKAEGVGLMKIFRTLPRRMPQFSRWSMSLNKQLETVVSAPDN